MMMQVQGGINTVLLVQRALASNDVPFHHTPFFVPRFQFPGLTIGGQLNYPNDTWQNTYSGRADVNWHLGQARDQVRRRVLARPGHQGLVPQPPRHLRVQQAAVRPRNSKRRFPANAWNNPAAWNISGLEPYLQRFDINFNPDYLIDTPRPTLALWFGDNWRISNKLSVNLGVRYDADWGASDPPGVTADRDP